MSVQFVVVAVRGLPKDCCVVGVGVWWAVLHLWYSVAAYLFWVLFFAFCLALLGHSVDALASRADEGRCSSDMPRGAGERALLSEGVRNGGTLTWVVLSYHHLNVYRVVGNGGEVKHLSTRRKDIRE